MLPEPLRKKVSVVIVEESISSEKVAVMVVSTATSVALLAGAVELTVGAGVASSDTVVNDHVYAAARAFPAKSLAPVVIVAV